MSLPLRPHLPSCDVIQPLDLPRPNIYSFHAFPTNYIYPNWGLEFDAKKDSEMFYILFLTFSQYLMDAACQMKGPLVHPPPPPPLLPPPPPSSCHHPCRPCSCTSSPQQRSPRHCCSRASGSRSPLRSSCSCRCCR